MSSKARPIHFHKRIDECSLQNGALRIPRSFVREYWKGIPNPVSLVVPDGDTWEVSWEEHFDVMILGANWKEFAKFYALDVEYSLSFSYLQDSHERSQFQVVIHDKDGLEIDYPSLLERTGEESDQSKKGKSPLLFSHSSKKMKFNPKEDLKSCHLKHEGTDSLRRKLENNTKHKNAVNSCYARGECSKSEAIKKEEPLEDTKISRALERAKASSSSNDIIRELCQSYIKRNVMSMPAKFIPAPLQKEGEGNVTLWVSEDSWVVRFKQNQRSKQISLNSGWKKFAEDNDLKLGDVCVFKEMNPAEVSFRVQIFRLGESSSPHQILDSEFPRNNSTKPENQFTIILDMDKLNDTRIPLEFIRKYITNWMYPMVLRFKKKDWTMDLFYHSTNYAKFNEITWSAFVNDSELKDGDECLFELVDEKKLVFQVIVTRRMY